MLRPLRAALLAAVIASMLPGERSLGTDRRRRGPYQLHEGSGIRLRQLHVRPERARTQWMRDHYWRMRAYSPYFDSRTTWYPGAWAYRDAYAIYRGSSWPTSTLTGC